MVLEDRVHRLPLANQGAYRLVQQGKGTLGDVDAGPGLCKDSPVLPVCRSCAVIVLVQPAGGLLVTAIADKGYLVGERTVVVEGNKVRTMSVALGAVSAFPFTYGGIGLSCTGLSCDSLWQAHTCLAFR